MDEYVIVFATTTGPCVIVYKANTSQTMKILVLARAISVPNFYFNDPSLIPLKSTI